MVWPLVNHETPNANIASAAKMNSSGGQSA
jgi:hypothetical protein